MSESKSEFEKQFPKPKGFVGGGNPLRVLSDLDKYEAAKEGWIAALKWTRKAAGLAESALDEEIEELEKL